MGRHFKISTKHIKLRNTKEKYQVKILLAEEWERGVRTLTRPLSGEQQNFSGNMEILPGIGRLKITSGKHEIISGHCRKKAGQDTT